MVGSPPARASFTGFDDKIISMYARGMTTRDIQAHLFPLGDSGADYKDRSVGKGGFSRSLVVILLAANKTESHRDLRNAETPEGIVLQIIEISGVAAILFSCPWGENAG